MDGIKFVPEGSAFELVPVCWFNLTAFQWMTGASFLISQFGATNIQCIYPYKSEEGQC